MTDNETPAKAPTPYRVYDNMTGAELGRYATYDMGYVKHPDKSITVRYLPSKKKVKKEFPYNG